MPARLFARLRARRRRPDLVRQLQRRRPQLAGVAADARPRHTLQGALSGTEDTRARAHAFVTFVGAARAHAGAAHHRAGGLTGLPG